MDNQQESLQYKIFMEHVCLNSLNLHKEHTQTNEDKINFIKSYLTMSAPNQYKYLNLGRGTVTRMRQKLLAYISNLPYPSGFVKIPINSKDTYLINSQGVVIRHLDRILVKQTIDTCGYYRSNIVHIRPNGSLIDYERTHRLVGLTFLDNPGNKPTINHIDGNKKNNSVDNLEWATYKENIKHAHDTGLHPKQNTARYDRRKFTEEQRIEILSFDSSITTASLARKYNLSEATIYNIRNNKHKK